ncbi:trypsin-like serine protease [Plesiomonas shigelloides subsp. oncorhynchi]|nr:trypsin-like serine protease [Plesiomonas shigelloides]
MWCLVYQFRLVLTAAHCVADKTWLAGANDVSVFAGQVDKDRFTPADEHPAAQVYVHRDYNPDSQLNDIALIRLSVSYTGGTLALANEAQSLQALVTRQGLRILGWGKTSNSATQGSTVLQTALLNPIDAQDCQTAWPDYPIARFALKGMRSVRVQGNMWIAVLVTVAAHLSVKQARRCRSGLSASVRKIAALTSPRCIPVSPRT